VRVDDHDLALLALVLAVLDAHDVAHTDVVVQRVFRWLCRRDRAVPLPLQDRHELSCAAAADSGR